MPFGQSTDEDKEVVVRQYGLLPPNDWGEDVVDELRRENRLWNRLVEIEHAHRKSYRELMQQDEAVARLEAALETEKAALAAATTEKKRKRQAGRKRVATTEEDAAIKDTRARIREIGPQLKEARKAAREAVRDELRALDAERKAAVKKARQESGLYWGNYNAVIGSYEVARQRAMKEGAELRFHGFDGGGRLTCQIQGGMSVGELFAGTHAQVGLAPVPPEAWHSTSRSDRRRLARTTLRFLAFTGRDAEGHRIRRYLTIPMVMHRPIPDDARIKQVVVTRTRIGPSFRWRVVFTCTMGSVAGAIGHAGSRAALNFGWRRTAGGIRVAMLVDAAGKRREITLPMIMLSRLERVEALHAQRDNAVNRLVAGLKEPLAQVVNEAPEALQERIQGLLRAPRIGPRSLARIAGIWSAEAPNFHPDLLQQLVGWRMLDKRYWTEAVNLRDKLTLRRTDIYRNAALTLVRTYSELVVEDTDFRQLAKRKTRDASGEDLPQPARHARVLASPGELRKWIGLQAAKTGTVITTRRGQDMTLTCSHCGHRHDPEVMRNRREDLYWTCGHCGARWDQDENHARNLLSA